MTVEPPIEDDVTQLAQRVEHARNRLAYQFDPALTEALSESELHAERELAERIREQERGQRWKEIQAVAAANDRARQTTEQIEKADMRDLLLARKAIAAQRRESSPHAKLASLYRHRSWSLRALAGVVAAGMLWSAVNVQQNIAPTGPSDPLFWFSYLLEGMISVCLIIIMIGTNKVAEWGVVNNRKQTAAAEVALLALTVGLNTYPYLQVGNWYEVGVHAVAPVMIGVALLIHDAASARYGMAILRATEQVRGLPDPAAQIRNSLPRVSMKLEPNAGDARALPTGDTAAAQPAALESGARNAGAGSAFRAEGKSGDAAKKRAGDLADVTSGLIGRTSSLLDEMATNSPLFDEPTVKNAEVTDKLPISNSASAAVKKLGQAKQAGAAGNGAGDSSAKGKLSGDKETDEFLEVVRSSDGYDTGQFRVADILEQELAELQAERRKARSGRARSGSTNGA
ncbi:hypothetical protein [Nocardia flavorosea]|uniref:Uncharacterized protein n=1 Tax=Nocardia flavorosea TaxID=53429 RepID=A0A846YIW7_9NOCA|nr:hypothetical protein [Nocardia flavorosea]NKY57761.1 hypothetical protein [Nocardia flavorosea]